MVELLLLLSIGSKFIVHLIHIDLHLHSLLFVLCTVHMCIIITLENFQSMCQLGPVLQVCSTLICIGVVTNRSEPNISGYASVQLVYIYQIYIRRRVTTVLIIVVIRSKNVSFPNLRNGPMMHLNGLQEYKNRFMYLLLPFSFRTSIKVQESLIRVDPFLAINTKQMTPQKMTAIAPRSSINSILSRIKKQSAKVITKITNTK